MTQSDRPSLERLGPQTFSSDDARLRETVALHLARYRYAAQWVEGLRVLDLACGIGYGSALLIQEGRARAVVGVDVDPQVIEEARQRYCCDGVVYLESTAEAYDDAEGFDVVVTLETIEHLADPVRFLQRMHGLLHDSGLLVASVPVTPSCDVNLHHKHDFTRRSFLRLLQRTGFTVEDERLQVQRYNPLATCRALKAGEWGDGVRRHLLGYYLLHPRAALKRVLSLLTDGPCNKYLIVAARKIPSPVTG